MVFDRIQKLWKNHGFEIILGLCLAFIIIYALYRKITGGKGTWSKEKHYAIPGSAPDHTRRSQPPRESKGEAECRRVLKYLFKKRFDKARPDFLRNPVTGGNFNLELDCYDPELKLAVEYNGEQHYRYIPYFHRNYDAFTNQKYRDDMKRRMCKDVQVNLIEVPHTIKLEDIKGFLERKLRMMGYKV